MKATEQQQTKEMRVFLAASLINAAGSSLMWPLVSMYVFDELGRSMTDAGLVILIQALGGILGQFLGGSLYYRIGVKRLIVGSISLNALVLFSLPFISHSWTIFIGAMALVGFFHALSMPAIQSFIGFRFAERRAEMFNIVYVANNVGVAIGTALSGFLADLSYTYSFIGNAVTSALFGLFFYVYLQKVQSTASDIPIVDTQRKRADKESTGIWPLVRHFRIYLFMAVGTLLLNLGNSIWNTGVSPFIIAEGLPKKMYGFLWTLNGILIFIAQPLINVIRRTIAKSVNAQMTASSIFYLAAYIVIPIMNSYTGMVLAMILATFGEMLISPAIPAFLSERGGKDAPFYLGLSGSISAIGRVAGPYMMGVLYDSGGLGPVAFLAIATAIVSTGFYCVHARLNR